MSHALHLALVPALILAIASMALKDAFGTVMTISQARGSSKLAGHADALGDGATAVCNAVGAGTVILTGFTPRALLIIAVIMVTSDLGTRYWTGYATRHVPPDPRDTAVLGRLDRMEACLASLRGDPGEQTDVSADA